MSCVYVCKVQRIRNKTILSSEPHHFLQDCVAHGLPLPHIRIQERDGQTQVPNRRFSEYQKLPCVWLPIMSHIMNWTGRQVAAKTVKLVLHPATPVPFWLQASTAPNACPRQASKLHPARIHIARTRHLRSEETYSYRKKMHWRLPPHESAFIIFLLTPP